MTAVLEAPDVWPDREGKPVSCLEKLKVLRENYEELAQVAQDAFEDAVLMGVDEAAMRRILMDVIARLKSPARGASE